VNIGPPVNSSYSELGPSVSGDGRFLYWSGHFANPPRPGAYGNADIWQASIEPVIDLNSDGIVDDADMCIMVENWGTDYSLCDIGPMPWGDGIVDVQDLTVLAEHLFEEILPHGCVAYWKLDQTEGDIAHNSTGDNDGICHGGPLWQPAGGRVGGALELDGIDDYIETDFVLNPADGAFSAFAWIKGGAPGQVMISQTDEAGQVWLGTDPLHIYDSPCLGQHIRLSSSKKWPKSTSSCFLSILDISLETLLFYHSIQCPWHGTGICFYRLL